MEARTSWKPVGQVDTPPHPQIPTIVPSGRSLGHQAVAFAGSSGIAQLATIVLYTFAARQSELVVFGRAAAAVALALTIASLVDLGTNSLWVRELSAGRLAKSVLDQRATWKFLAALTVAAVWIPAASAIGFEPAVALAGAIVPAMVLSQLSTVALRGARTTHIISIGMLSDRATAVAVFLGVALLTANSALALTSALAVGPLVGAVVNNLLTPTDSRPCLDLKPNLPWQGAGFFGLGSMAISAQTLDLPLLTSMGGSIAGGLYGSISRWTQPMSLFAAAFATTAAPFIAQSGSVRAAWDSVKRAIWLPVAAIAVCIAMAALSPLAVPFILGDRYSDAVPALQIVCFAALMSVVSQPMFAAMQYLGHEKRSGIMMCIAVATQLVLVGILAAPLGAIGAALASLTAQFIVMTYCFVSLLLISRSESE